MSYFAQGQGMLASRSGAYMKYVSIGSVNMTQRLSERAIAAPPYGLQTLQGRYPAPTACSRDRNSAVHAEQS